MKKRIISMIMAMVITAGVLSIVSVTASQPETVQIPTNADGSVTLGYLTIRFRDEKTVEIVTNTELPSVVFGLDAIVTGVTGKPRYDSHINSQGAFLASSKAGGFHCAGSIARNGATLADTTVIWWDTADTTVTVEGECFIEENRSLEIPHKVKFTVEYPTCTENPFTCKVPACEQCSNSNPLPLLIDPCSSCKICESGKTPVQGRITGDAQPQIFDALEILKNLVGMDGAIKKCGNALNAALITKVSQEKGAPTIFDALEILKHLVGMTKL